MQVHYPDQYHKVTIDMMEFDLRSFIKSGRSISIHGFAMIINFIVIKGQIVVIRPPMSPVVALYQKIRYYSSAHIAPYLRDVSHFSLTSGIFVPCMAQIHLLKHELKLIEVFR